MEKNKLFIIASLIFLGLGLVLIFQSRALGKLRIIACDVGQGDGILIISPSGKQILVDGGPGSKIIDCMSQKMPFWDRTVEMIIATHPQKDHMEGLVEVLTRYKVQTIITTGVKNESALFQSWQKATGDENAKIYNPKAGDRIVIDQFRGSTRIGIEPLSLIVLWPTQNQLNNWSQSPPKDLNDSSIVMRLEYGTYCAYLTGDISKEFLVPLIDKECQILKISHHGSKTGTDEEILEKAKPQIAIIQVGKNNYGHPHKDVLGFLESKKIKILRNDLLGTIELATDGKSLKLKTAKSK